MKPARSFFIPALLSGFAAVAILIAITEFFVIPRALGYPRDVLLLRHIAPPGATIDGQLINSMGFAGDVIALEKPEDTIRILILGGSVMFNRHLGDRLKASLQQHTSHNIELVNAGIRSHNSRSDLYKMQRMAPYKFNYVIYYNGVNDLVMNRKSPLEYQEDYSHSSPWLRQNSLFEKSLVAFFIYKLYWDGYNKFFGHETDKLDNNYYDYRSVNSFVNNVREIAQLTKIYGGAPVLMTFAYTIPDNYTQQSFNKDKLGYINPDHYDRWPVEGWGTPDYVRNGLNKINAGLRHIAATEGIELIDMDQQLSGQIHLFGDFCHFNEEGVDVFVSIVTDRFIQKGWLH